ncbi:efflux RND transporter periplasmic adaptor subunit [Luteimonas huabeiensis]|uniref:efflux RND transporter periplasmic adaptor subunit n=1 Tax=Luteimonas huabeiensis TaxID=1244513 RepID=UPI00046752D9|nr:efflux RND transporter periplasmic adaptor subunit [Luteimonas huabeiensis]
MNAPRLLFRAALLAAALFTSACGRDEAAPEAARPVLVDAAPAGAAAAALALPGEIRAREESPLSFRVGGQLIRRHVDAGAEVRRGQVLAELDSGDLRLQVQSAQAQYSAAEAELVRARAEQARYAELARERLVSASALEAQTTALRAAEGQARAARAQLDVARNQSDYAELRAPEDGVIASREAEAGQVVGAGQTVYVLAADGAREVAIALPETRIHAFSLGQPAEVELWSAPGRRLPGRIREIAPAADPQARTYAARVALDDAALDEVALGQSARVYLRQAADAPRSVPLSAVQRGEDGAPVVWIVAADGTAQPRPVELGAYGEERVPVRSGLPEDALVIAAGAHLLRPGQRVTPVDRNNRPIQPNVPKPDGAKAD